MINRLEREKAAKKSYGGGMTKKTVKRQAGGPVAETVKGNRGTKEQGMRAYDYQQEIKKEHEERMKYIEEQLSDNRGGKGK